MDFSELQAMVIDNGSGLIKAGYSSDPAPRATFPAVTGRLKCCGMPPMKDLFIGKEALTKRPFLVLQYPIDHGIVTNWEEMERLWTHTFYTELRSAPEEHPIILTESLFNPSINRERTTMIMFESFNIPALCLSGSPLFALLASGRTSGLVLECGHDVTQSVPISDGFPLRYAALQGEFAGKQLTANLGTTIEQRYESLGYLFRGEIARNMKESLCFVSQTGEVPIDSDLTKNYELPDGVFVALDKERYMIPEALFRPAIAGRESAGVQELPLKSIKRCCRDIRAELYGNIVLSGGSTLFPGFTERITKEMQATAPVHVISPPDRLFSAWKGGAVLSSSACFKQMCITKEEYEEYGPMLIHRKYL